MIPTLALAVWPISLTKLGLCTLLLLIWAKWSSVVDKDSTYYRLKHRLWNSINVASACIGFALVFLVPIFLLGFLLILVFVGGAMSAYFNIRNKNVPTKAKWAFNADTFRKLMLERRQARAEKAAGIKFKSGPGAPPDLKPVPLADDDRYEAHMRLEEVLDVALQRRAQCIDLTGGDATFQASLWIDGVEYKHSKFTSEEALPMIDYLRLHVGHNIADRRKLQTGTCSIESASQGKHDLKVLSSGSTRGFQCLVEIDPVKQVSIPLKELGLLESQFQQIQSLIRESKGVVLVATPPEQGRTTTLYCLTNEHDPYTMDIQVIEQEKERELDAVTSSTIPATEVAAKLRSTLLRDPHVLMVSAVTDQPTARQIAEGGALDKRIYAGLRAEDTFSALKLWAKAVGDRQIVAKSLHAILSQRLLRKLCPYCRQKYKPDAAALKKLNLPADKIKELFKAGGKVVVKNEPEPCPACHGIGYIGRVAAFEVMVLDDDARKLLAAGQMDALRAHVRRQKTLWLEEAALQKVVEGVTSIGEAMRAMGQAPKAD